MFGLGLDLRQYFVHVISEDSGETARLRSLARVFADHLFEKYKKLIGRLRQAFCVISFYPDCRNDRVKAWEFIMKESTARTKTILSSGIIHLAYASTAYELNFLLRFSRLKQISFK